MDKEKEKEDVASINIFEGFFNNFIKTGVLQKEFEVAKDFKIKLKVLNSEESVVADALFNIDNPTIGEAGYLRLRSAAIIAMSTVSINGVDVVDNEVPIGRISKVRYSLYGYFLKMPTEIMAKIWDCYLEVSKEQSDKYSDQTGEEIKNS